MVLEVYARWGITLVWLLAKLKEGCMVLLGAGDAFVVELMVGSVEGLVIIRVEKS